MRVAQYLPAFVDPVNIEREETTAANIEELLAIPWIAFWTRQDGFVRFSVCADRIVRAPWGPKGPHGEGLRALMVEMSDGKHHVVGGLEEPERYGLPEWSAP